MQEQGCCVCCALPAQLLALSVCLPALAPQLLCVASKALPLPGHSQGARWALGVPWHKAAEAPPLPPLPADTYDEVAQYLDHLLQRTVPQSNLPPTASRGGLSRFRAAVHTTRDLMSLASKAKDLHVQSE